MIATIKSKCLEELKMSRAEEYDYNKFLSDSSDDHPKYADGIESEKTTDQQAECRDTEDLKVALHNVLEVSNDWLSEQDMLSISEDDRKGIERSIRITENFLSNLADSNIALAKADS
tara:strand:+ start:124 stop:474 length:351 start_codon:yes stop_codon:yes gene_type:complete